MDYLQASKRFSTDDFLKRLLDLDLLEMIEKLNKEIGWADQYTVPQKSEYRQDINSLRIAYMNTLSGLELLLSTGTRSKVLDHSIFMSFRPIIEALVDKNQLKESALKVFV